MSLRPRGVEEIDGALQALETVSSLVIQGRREFDLSQAQRLALAMCWVSVGSQLKQFARARRISAPVPELSGPIRMRDKLSYQPLSDLDTTSWGTHALTTRNP